MTRWSPFRDLDLMERRMRRLFPDMWFLGAPTPPADVFETDDEVVVELEVPGFTEKQLDIELFDHTLLVKGDRKLEKEREEKAFHVHERLAETFERRFALPPDVDSERVEAFFDRGVLELHVPKLAQTKPKRVEIAAKT